MPFDTPGIDASNSIAGKVAANASIQDIGGEPVSMKYSLSIEASVK
jgi:hypothetical protein